MKVKNYRLIKVAGLSADNLEENKSNEYNKFSEKTKEIDCWQV